MESKMETGGYVGAIMCGLYWPLAWVDLGNALQRSRRTSAQMAACIEASTT